MSDFEQIQAIVQILSLLAATVLVFLGIRKTVKALNKEDRYADIPKDLVFKSTRLIAFGLLFVALFFCINLYTPMREDGFPMTIIALQALWETVYKTGFLLLLPYVIVRLKNPRKPQQEK
ncbi:MAG: hypothetical protein GXY06_04805 [Clostridiaceae bacterium]|nr:hypothetical protein [Clostridiaceae bacterium]